ncbi:MFS transporter [Acidaminobacter sp. JC074]|uniref:hypothetical protein n=1 Tax=Acidaminobacter sp. JC074 TaxID=2530199 RepID=UPI001F0D1245|nr:hypothetical protein [Acidaminobacter sp. JC074]MCH4887537.1 MFS transporter [Acidaminobacter sp. JC074]
MLAVMFFLMTTGLIQGIMFVLAALSLSMSNSSVLVIASEIFPENLILTNGLMMGLAAGLSGALLIIFGVFAEQVGLYNTIISLNILLLLASAYSLLIPKRGSKCRLSDLQYA